MLPETLIAVCTLVLIWFFRELLAEAQRSDIELGTLVPLFVAVLGMAFAAGVLVLGQSARSARRLNGPTQRLVLAMQRTRRGDIGHRVHLRHGDSLKEVAAEFNKLLDWLNANPPQGIKETGSDLIEVERQEETEMGLTPAELLERDLEADIVRIGADD